MTSSLCARTETSVETMRELNGVFPEDALWWVQYAYPREWETFALQNPGNPAEAFLEDFQRYYRGAERLGRTLTQRQLQGTVSPIMQRFSDHLKTAGNAQDDKEISALTLFVKDMESFCRLYDFLSQIVPFSDPDLEKRHPARAPVRRTTKYRFYCRNWWTR